MVNSGTRTGVGAARTAAARSTSAAPCARHTAVLSAVGAFQRVLEQRPGGGAVGRAAEHDGVRDRHRGDDVGVEHMLSVSRHHWMLGSAVRP